MSQVAEQTGFRIVGTVTRPHGIQGTVKVRPETDDPTRLQDLEYLYLGETEETLTRHAVTSIGFQPFKTGIAVLVEFDAVQGREGAASLAGQTVWASEADLPPLEEGEVFLSDLVGLKVLSGGKEVGEVVDVLELPAHPTLSIRMLDAAVRMVPFVPELVPDVNLDSGFLSVVPLEGLLEGEADSERE